MRPSLCALICFNFPHYFWSLGWIYPLSWNFENTRDVFFLYCLVEFMTPRHWVISCVFSPQAPSRLQCGATLNTSIKAFCGRYGLIQCCNYNTCAWKECFASITATRSSIISSCKCDACIVIMLAEQKQHKSMGGFWLTMLLLQERCFICWRFIKLLECVQMKWDVSLAVNKHAVTPCSHLSSSALKGASPLWELVSLIIASSFTWSLGPPPFDFSLSVCSFLYFLSLSVAFSLFSLCL